MKRSLRIEPDAETELTAAAEWYERQRPGIGFDLLDEAKAAYGRLSEGDSGSPVPGIGADLGARRVPIQRFPLWVVFTEHAGQILIVAFAHDRRRPGYWLKRVQGT